MELMKPEIPLLFTQNWNTYQKVVRSNYMLHEEFSALTFNYLELQSRESPLIMLDLGCGDGGILSKGLGKLKVDSYTGYDLSGIALSLCKEQLEPLGFPVHLREGKMEDLLQKEQNKFNLIYSSFAIHHLQDNEKKELIRSIYEHLVPGGRFLFIDVYRKPGATLEEYYNSYLSNVNKNWKSLETEEKNRIEDHIRNYDFPAYREQLEAWCIDSGFVVEDKPDLDHWHQVMVLKK
jgi:ubiquinone/menaquinone biosynthesis C-methylase UbiE